MKATGAQGQTRVKKSTMMEQKAGLGTALQTRGGRGRRGGVGGGDAAELGGIENKSSAYSDTKEGVRASACACSETKSIVPAPRSVRAKVRRTTLA